MFFSNIKEEELKNKVAEDFFSDYDTTEIIGKIDFAIVPKGIFIEQYLLWAEAKKGDADLYATFVQLILTIGKAQTFNNYLPPPYLGAFDYHKFAFVPYHQIQDFFYQNDFNWNVRPSDHNSKEFIGVYNKVKSVIDAESLVFSYDDELREFIKTKFQTGDTVQNKLQIDKNNFVSVYLRWRREVMPTIFLMWDLLKKDIGIIDADFYLADLLSDENMSLKDSLAVLLKSDYYYVPTGDNYDFGVVCETFLKIRFRDNQKAHRQFWNKYKRPPKEELWDWMIERRELLVPQDVRERKGSFFTPPEWVELSQRYLADVFGEDWQEEYYIWDCAAGTGNLLVGLTEKNRVFASTIDMHDVKVMHDRIDNGTNLLKKNCFQFDFLNDEFDKLPKELQQIINNPEKRKKLIMYINPPYAEAGKYTREKKTGLAVETMVNKKLYEKIKSFAKRELFAQFLTRIYFEIPDCKVGTFSTLKGISAPYFKSFREFFQAKFMKGFIIPSKTFDNVNGNFPIAFQCWNTEIKKPIKNCNFDVYWARIENPKNTGGIKYIKEIKKIGKKKVYSYDKVDFINDWIRPDQIETEKKIGYMVCNGNDFQTQKTIAIHTNKINETSTYFKSIDKDNLTMSCIYYSVRKIIKATWLNDRDQFLHPNEKWKKDIEFKNDCLAYTLFHGSNNIQAKHGTNHWIPFTEKEVGALDLFESNFMSDFIAGKVRVNNGNGIFIEEYHPDIPVGNTPPPREGNRTKEFPPCGGGGSTK